MARGPLPPHLCAPRYVCLSSCEHRSPRRTCLCVTVSACSAGTHRLQLYPRTVYCVPTLVCRRTHSLTHSLSRHHSAPALLPGRAGGVVVVFSSVGCRRSVRLVSVRILHVAADSADSLLRRSLVLGHLMGTAVHPIHMLRLRPPRKHTTRQRQLLRHSRC
jgi:hypothetical protein